MAKLEAGRVKEFTDDGDGKFTVSFWEGPEVGIGGGSLTPQSSQGEHRVEIPVQSTQVVSTVIEDDLATKDLISGGVPSIGDPSSDFSLGERVSATLVTNGNFSPDGLEQWRVQEELISGGSAKAVSSAPVGFKSWLGTSSTTGNEGLRYTLVSSSQPLSMEESTAGSHNLNSTMHTLVKEPRSGSADGVGTGSCRDNRSDMLTTEAFSTSDMEHGNQLVLDLKHSLKNVLGEAVKGKGNPLGDSVVAITFFSSLLEQALGHGLKDGRSRWAQWSSGKDPASLFNSLAILEHRLPLDPVAENEIFWGSVGLKPVDTPTWVRTSAGRLRAWIRQSLNTGSMGARLKLLVKQQKLLEKWYEAWGLLRRDDIIDELLSIAMALDAVPIDLTVDSGAALDHLESPPFEPGSSTSKALESDRSNHLDEVREGYAADDPDPDIGQLSVYSGPQQSSALASGDVKGEKYTANSDASFRSRLVFIQEDDEAKSWQMEEVPVGEVNMQTSRDASSHTSAVNALSPPLSPCSSPGASTAGLGEQMVSSNGGFTAICSQYREERVKNIGSGNIAGSPDKGLDPVKCDLEGVTIEQVKTQESLEQVVTKEGFSDCEDTSECESMFGVGSDNDDEVSLPAGESSLPHTHFGRKSNNLWLIQTTEDEVAFGGDDWSDFVQENGLQMEKLVDISEDPHAESGLSDETILLRVSYDDGHTERSDEARKLPEYSEGNDGDGLFADLIGQIRGTGRPDLDENDDEDDNRFEGHLDEQEIIPSGSNTVSTLRSSPAANCSFSSGSGRPDLEEDGIEIQVEVDVSHPDGTLEEHSCVMSNNPSAFPCLHDHQDQCEGQTGGNAGTFSAGLGSLLAGTNSLLPSASGITEGAKMEEEASPGEEKGPSAISSSVEREQLFPSAPGHGVEEGAVCESSKGRDQSSISLRAKMDGDELRPPLAADGTEVTGSRNVFQVLATNFFQNVTAKIGSGPSTGSVNLAGGSRDIEELEEENLLEVSPSICNAEGQQKRGCIMRLGSKEAEELLQLDVTKMGRAVHFPVKIKGKGGKLPGVGKKGVDWGADDLGPDELSRYVETLEVKETYIDTVLDMEDVLLDSDEGSGPRVFQTGNIPHKMPIRPAQRDGSLTASTSGVAGALGSRSFQLSGSPLMEVTWVEVVGARQRRGGASLGERVVGVQEHTLYRMLVRNAGGREWEIERRYRDFVSLYQQLNRMFSSQSDFCLPAPWRKVRSESRKVFGNTSPNVVEVRSALIQVCLQSLLQAGNPLNNAAPVLRFFVPTGSFGRAVGGTQSPAGARGLSGDARTGESQLPLEEFDSEFTRQQQSPRSDTASTLTESETEEQGPPPSVFGKTIRLIVQVHKRKSMKQQLHAQHHACAGCYKQLDLPRGLVPGLVQSLGLGGPWWCEYSDQLFCSACHLNETAVLPAYVLQHWDFVPRRVSQLAKAYLDSIFDQAYLLEDNDFFALRDLADLSKGAFAGLPGFMRTLSDTLSMHIKRECAVCHELGESCGAVEMCDDPFDIMYPFQDEDITRCVSCQLPFHKRCFVKCKTCPSCAQEVGPKQSLVTSNATVDLPLQDPASSSLADTELTNDDSAANNYNPPLIDNQVTHKRNFLASLLTPKGSKNIEAPVGRRDSVVLNMSAFLGPIEL